MPRPLRNIQPDVVYAFTRRTRDGKFAFVPHIQLVCELVGVLAEAQRRWPQVDVHQIEFMSNHVHGSLSVRGPNAANALAEWSSFVFGQAALVAQAVHGLTGEIWERKQLRLIPILDDAALRSQSKYIMAQAVAAGLVRRPRDWPGISSSDAVCRGDVLVGYRASAALRRRAREDGVPLASIAPRRVFRVAPLPSQRGWTVAQRETWHRAIEREVIEEAAAERPARGYRSAEALRAVSPTITLALDESPAPRCHAAAENHAARRAWRDQMRAFTRAWREALQAWIDGARACFPVGGWVPFGACYAAGYVQRE